MDSWLLQALTVLVTAPWWLLLVRLAVDSTPAATAGRRGLRSSHPNERAFEQARAAWGRSVAARSHVPRRLRNAAWSTGRAVGPPRPRPSLAARPVADRRR